MKHKLIAIFSLLSIGLTAQNELPTEKSLLWEISGNGLKKSSYLYGTMHVSAKIAFRLDDVFFNALNNADMVALESDPSTWLEHYSEDGSYSNYYNPYGYNQSGFYKESFKAENPKKEFVGRLMSFDNNILNGILYRSSKQRQDFQEDTYLDMFIYQAGSKQNKPIISLEDLDESQMLVDIAGENSRKDKPDVWLQKMMVEENYYSIMQEAYRTRNISLLDSLDRGWHTDHYMSHMLYKRNHNMLTVMDSVMQKGSVFSAIGAAHLPGEEGVINLLRKEGYTVKPYTSERTEKAENEKDKLDKLFIDQDYSIQSPDDNFFSVNLPDKLHNLGSFNNATNYISTDLTNGAFFTVTRISKKQFLKSDQEVNLEIIKDLLFENIPGDIESKKDITNGKWSGIEVKNKLKNGDLQHYQMYDTPLEVIIFKLSGKKNYAELYGDKIFSTLKFKSTGSANSVNVESHFKDFSLNMPDFYAFPNKFNAGDREIEAYDASEDAYYFLKRVQLNDTRFFEVDSFEVKQIQKRFLEDLKVWGDIQFENSFKINNFTASRSKAQIDSASNVNMHLMSLKQGKNYYLLGVKTDKQALADNYFTNFKVGNSQYQEQYTTLVDTFLYFSTESFLDMSKKWSTNNNIYAKKDDRKKPYEEYYKFNRYITENGDRINVEMTKYHDLSMSRHVDSVWNRIEYRYEDDFEILSSERGESNGFPYLQLVISDTACSKTMIIKEVINHGVIYELTALTDINNEPNKYINSFFDNFKPKDTLIGRSIFEDKTNEFFAALRANDSIVYDAYDNLYFGLEDLDSLKSFVNSFEFPEDHKKLKERFIYKIGSFEDEDETVVPYLIDLYTKSYENSEIQADILAFFARKRTKDDTEQMMELLNTDIPLTAYSYSLNSVFYPYKDSLELGKELFPEIMDYQTIKEYKEPIFSLLTKLRQENVMKEKSIKKYRNQILNDARIELKRELAKSNKSSSNYYGSYGRYGGSFYNSRSNYKDLSDLEQYIILLYPFKDEKNMKVFFERLEKLDNAKVITTYLALQAKNNDEPNLELIEEFAEDINKRFNLFVELQNVNRLDLFPEEYKTQQSILEAYTYKNGRYKEDNDTISFIDKIDFEFEGKSYTNYYYKTSQKTGYNKDEWTIKSYTIANFEEDEDFKPAKNNNGVKADITFIKSRKLLETVEVEKQLNKLIEAFELEDHPRATSKLDEGGSYYGSYY